VDFLGSVLGGIASSAAWALLRRLWPQLVEFSRSEEASCLELRSHEQRADGSVFDFQASGPPRSVGTVYRRWMRDRRDR
jgi:hypothetical protein